MVLRKMRTKFQDFLLARLDKVQEELLYHPRLGRWRRQGHCVSKVLKFYVNVFKISYFLNPLIDLNYIWYDDRYWSKNLFRAIPTPGHDL